MVSNGLCRPFGRWPQIATGQSASSSEPQEPTNKPTSSRVGFRVARFFLVRDSKTGKNVPNEHKMYQNSHQISQMSVKIPNTHKICRHFPSLGPPKFTQFVIFGLKINHLATLVGF
jgi:hypothetical protein